jgi:hypothetical protein
MSEPFDDAEMITYRRSIDQPDPRLELQLAPTVGIRITATHRGRRSGIARAASTPVSAERPRRRDAHHGLEKHVCDLAGLYTPPEAGSRSWELASDVGGAEGI